MVVENVVETVIKLGDQSGDYTEEEMVAVRQLHDMIEEDEIMRQWIKYAQKNILIIAIRACDMNVKKCYKIMTKIFHLATKTYPEIILLVNPLTLRPIVDLRMFKMVRRPTDEGPAVITFKIKDWIPSKTATLEQVAVTAGLYIYSVAKVSAEIQRQGLIVMADAEGFNLSHVTAALKIDLFMKGLRFYSCIPPLLKGIVIINSFRLVESTYNSFKWLIPAKFRKIIHVTRKNKIDLPELLPLHKVPAEFGGTIPDADAYVQGIEERLLAEPELFDLLKHIQDEFITYTKIKS